MFPRPCNLIACQGNVVCANAQLNVDYCTGAVLSLPPLPGAPVVVGQAAR